MTLLYDFMPVELRLDVLYRLLQAKFLYEEGDFNAVCQWT
jgi:hypothetical protein